MVEVGRTPETASLRQLLDAVTSYIATLEGLKLNSLYYSIAMYSMLLRAIPRALSARFLSNLSETLHKTGEQSGVNSAEEKPSHAIQYKDNLPSIFASRFSELIDFLTREADNRERQQALCSSHNINFPAAATSGTRAQKEGYPSWSRQRNSKGPREQQQKSF